MLFCISLLLVLVINKIVTSGIIDNQNIFNKNNELNNSHNEYLTELNNTRFLAVLLKTGAKYDIPWCDEYTESLSDASSIQIKFEDIKISKECNNYYVFGDFDEKSQSYAFVNIKMKNLGNRSFESTLNRFYLIIGPNNGYELHGFNTDKNINSQDYYHVTFLPNKEYSFTLIYKVDDNVYEEYGNETFLYVSMIDTGKDWHYTIPVIEKEE